MSKKITRSDLMYLKDLAKIELTEDEITGYTSDLDAIVQYAAMLQEVDVAGVEPMYTPILDKGTPLREDIVKPSLTQAEALSQAKDTEAGYFRVPKTLEG